MRKTVILILTLIMLLNSLCGCEFLDKINELNLEFYELNEGDVVEIITEVYQVSSPEFDSCYKSLNKKQKELYEKLYSISEEMPKGFVRLTKDYSRSSADVAIAYNALLNDKAEIFWMPNTYIIGKIQTSASGYDLCIAFNHTTKENTTNYKVDSAKRNKMRNELDKVVNDIVSKSENFKSQLEKEKFFNDYICENTEYNDSDGLQNTAYGCLVQKQALCEGYSRAFKLLCNKSGIECDLIVGEAEGEGHMWNSINIDGIHSFVDVTWNDNPDYKYFYFNLTNEQIEFDHIISPTFKELTETQINEGISFNFVKRICTYPGNGYFQKYGYMVDDLMYFDYAIKSAEFITKNNEKGLKFADILLNSTNLKDDFLADENAFILKIQKQLKGIKIESYVFLRDVLVIYYKSI